MSNPNLSQLTLDIAQLSNWKRSLYKALLAYQWVLPEFNRYPLVMARIAALYFKAGDVTRGGDAVKILRSDYQEYQLADALEQYLQTGQYPDFMP